MQPNSLARVHRLFSVRRTLLFIGSLVVLVVAQTVPTWAAFGGICGRRDGCGNPNNDFRIFGNDSAPTIDTPAQQATNINNEGAALEKQGNLEAALQKYQQALALNPNSQKIQDNIRNIRARIAYERGRSASKRDDFDAATAAFREALTHKPGDQVLSENLRQAEAGREEQQRRVSMQQGLNRMADILNNTQPAVTSGLDFDGGSAVSTPGSGAGGLDFVPATPANSAASASKAPTGSGCSVHTDASVVDLCGMGDRPVVDPAKLKSPVTVARAPQPLDPSIAAAKRELDRRLDKLFEQPLLDMMGIREFDQKHDEAMSRFLFDMMQPSRWRGPANPNPRLINPLNEPERYEAWKKSIDARLQIHAKQGKQPTLVERLDRDPAITAARDRIVKKQEEAEHKAFTRALSDMQAALEKLRNQAKLKDYKEFEEKERQDPAFKLRVDAARNSIVQSWVREEQAARRAAVKEMIREIEKWQSAQSGR